MTTLILLLFVLLLAAADTVLLALVFLRLYANDPEERLEREVEKHLSRDKMEQGIENILTFSVNGKTGFEGQDTEEE